MPKEILSVELLEVIENNSQVIDRTIGDIIKPYCDELDRYIMQVDSSLRDNRNPLTDKELDEIVLNLSTMLYFTSVGCEQIGIRDDLSKTQYKEAYNAARALLKTGTVADKNTEAEIQTLSEHLISVVYSKAYKILRAKVETAQELLASVKKVISRRCAEYELTRMNVNG